MPASEPRGKVLVVHGLDASKEVMRTISAALADGGFEVYSIDLPGHGDSPVGFQASRAGEAIRKVLEQTGRETAVLGHSLGAGLLLDLAETQHFSTMVLLAPPPVPISRIQADRVLIATGRVDLPRIREFIPIAADIAGPNTESWILRFGAHSAAIFNPEYVRRTVQWMGGDGRRVRTLARYASLIAMLAAAVVFGVTLMPRHDLEPAAVHIPSVLVRYVVGGGAPLLVLRFINPLWWLRLFATGYVVGFVFITGAVAAAAYVIVVIGWIAASQVLHMNLSGGRWWRFPAIALAGFPLFLFDEWMLRRIQPFWKSAAAAVVSRAILWALLLTGVQVFSRENMFLVLIAHLIAAFWIGLWFAAGVVHRNTQSPAAAALFASIVQGWVFAAWFVTI